jgi:hypothetical protein
MVYRAGGKTALEPGVRAEEPVDQIDLVEDAGEFVGHQAHDRQGAISDAENWKRGSHQALHRRTDTTSRWTIQRATHDSGWLDRRRKFWINSSGLTKPPWL